MMKFSISVSDRVGPKAPFVLQGDCFENIKLAKRIGYDAVEIHIREPKNIDIRGIKNLCRNENIAVSSVGTGLAYSLDRLSLMSKDEYIRQKAIDKICEFIQMAEILESVVILGLIKGIVPPDEDYATCESRVAGALEKCLKEAEKRNVTIVLEAINRYESNFLVNVDEILSFIKKFDTEFLKVHLDSFHMNIEEGDIGNSIVRCGDKLGHVHFADNDRMYPGHGHINFKEIIGKLEEIDYKGYIAIECLPLPEPELVARRSLEYLRSIS